MTDYIKEERVGRFGHHPDAMTDYEIEVESIENEWHNIKIDFMNGTPMRDALVERVARAMTAGPFITEHALGTKDRLRVVESEMRARRAGGE